jgi:hypothetical protein
MSPLAVEVEPHRRGEDPCARCPLLSFVPSPAIRKTAGRVSIPHSAGLAIRSPRGMGEPRDIAPRGNRLGSPWTARERLGNLRLTSPRSRARERPLPARVRRHGWCSMPGCHRDRSSRGNASPSLRGRRARCVTARCARGAFSAEPSLQCSRTGEARAAHGSGLYGRGNGAREDGRMLRDCSGGSGRSDKMIRRVSLNRRQGGTTRAPS